MSNTPMGVSPTELFPLQVQECLLLTPNTMPSVHNLTISDTEFGIDESRVHPCRNPKGQKVPAGLVLDKEKFRLGQSVILLTPNGKYFATGDIASGMFVNAASSSSETTLEKQAAACVSTDEDDDDDDDDGGRGGGGSSRAQQAAGAETTEAAAAAADRFVAAYDVVVRWSEGRDNSRPNTKSRVLRVPATLLFAQRGGHRDRAMIHSGDEIDRDAGTGKHTIKIDLEEMPRGITDVALCLSAYRSKDLSKFENPTVRLYAKDPRHQLAQFTLQQSSSEHVTSEPSSVNASSSSNQSNSSVSSPSRTAPSRTCTAAPLRRGGRYTSSAVVMCVINRTATGQSWNMVSCGLPCGGTAHNLATYQPMIRAVQPLQARHGHWRRRAAAVRHLSLLVKGRSFPIAGNEAPVSEALIRVTELPEDLTHTIIKFL